MGPALRGSNFTGFKLAGWALARGMDVSTSPPWRALMARMLTLGSFRGFSVVRESDTGAALGAATGFGMEEGAWGGGKETNVTCAN